MTLLCLFGTLQINSVFAAGTTVSLPPSTNGAVGMDFGVDVTISDVVGLHTWEFKLFYETDCINAVKVTEGPFMKAFANGYSTYFTVIEINDAYNSTHGLVWASCSLPYFSATGSGTLATVYFEGVDTGTADMALETVKLKDSDWQTISCVVTDGEVVVAWPETLDINTDMGTIYFSGEQVECFILTTFHGLSVTPTSISTMLYDPEGGSTQLTPEQVSTGFYKVTHTIPSDASSGTYAIKVEATYVTDSVQACGASFKTWLLSSTLNSKLVSIDDTVAWIKTNVGLLQTDVSNLNLQVTSIEDSTATIQTNLGTLQGTITSINNNVATIQTSIGTVQTTLGTLQGTITSIYNNVATVQTNLGTLQGTITSINNNVATIQTDVGTIKVDLSTVKSYTTPKAVDWTAIGLYISLALLVSIAVVLVVLYFYLRARFRSGTVPS